jgi:hypothetical protein
MEIQKTATEKKILVLSKLVESEETRWLNLKFLKFHEILLTRINELCNFKNSLDVATQKECSSNVF